MIVAVKTPGGFDILNMDEVNTSIVRNANQVQLSWNNGDALYQLRKTVPCTLAVGTSLRPKGNCLIPTGDTGIAKLVSLEVVNTKQVTIDGVAYTAKLMSVQL